MREPTYLVLAALAGGRQHGYGLIQDVESFTAGRVRLSAGTLYGVLDRLSDEGLVSEDGEEVVAGRLRRFYVLAPAGADALAEQTAIRQSSAKVAARRLRALGVQS